ncbi:uncharacterized protein LOC144138596 [Haemaphysalis longicornis]
MSWENPTWKDDPATFGLRQGDSQEQQAAQPPKGSLQRRQAQIDYLQQQHQLHPILGPGAKAWQRYSVAAQFQDDYQLLQQEHGAASTAGGLHGAPGGGPTHHPTQPRRCTDLYPFGNASNFHSAVGHHGADANFNEFFSRALRLDAPQASHELKQLPST